MWRDSPAVRTHPLPVACGQVWKARCAEMVLLNDDAPLKSSGRFLLGPSWLLTGIHVSERDRVLTSLQEETKEEDLNRHITHIHIKIYTHTVHTYT